MITCLKHHHTAWLVTPALVWLAHYLLNTQQTVNYLLPEGFLGCQATFLLSVLPMSHYSKSYGNHGNKQEIKPFHCGEISNRVTGGWTCIRNDFLQSLFQLCN